MEQDNKQVMEVLSPKKVILPVLIGLGVAAFFIYQLNFEEVLQNISTAKIGWLIAAFLVLMTRDVGYMYRIRNLTDKKLSWLASFYIIILWEFASAVTPSVVGGTAVAVFIINRERIPFGKSLAYVMLTAVLDNTFFILAAPLGILTAQFMGMDIFPPMSEGNGAVMAEYGLSSIFIISYVLITIYNILFAYGLFFHPEGFKWLLGKVTSIGFLKKWHQDALHTGDEVVIASAELRGKDGVYWAKAILSTLFVWLARYFMLNCLIAAFRDINMLNHLLIFARQIVMWIVMLIAPTPGSSGAAEVAFSAFYEEFLGSFSSAVALLWRMFYYYPYLIAGIIVLPRWLRRVYDFAHRDKKKQEGKENQL